MIKYGFDSIVYIHSQCSDVYGILGCFGTVTQYTKQDLKRFEILSPSQVFSVPCIMELVRRWRPVLAFIGLRIRASYGSASTAIGDGVPCKTTRQDDLVSLESAANRGWIYCRVLNVVPFPIIVVASVPCIGRIVDPPCFLLFFSSSAWYRLVASSVASRSPRFASRLLFTVLPLGRPPAVVPV